MMEKPPQGSAEPKPIMMDKNPLSGTRRGGPAYTVGLTLRERL